MCKAWSDAQKDAEIRSAVNTARRYGISDSKIREDIIAQFDLTESEANSYMLKKSA